MYLKKVVFVLLVLVTATSVANVTLDINNTKYSYPFNLRMDEALEPIAFEQPWYWSASKLFRVNNHAQLKQKNEILRVLSVIQQNKSYAVELKRLKREVQEWDVLSRVNTPIDFELARLENKYNPRFESGDYKLLLSTRPNYILFLGALPETRLAYENKTVLNDYLENLSIPREANSNKIVVLAPNGQRTPVSNYSFTLHYEPMPGSVAFLPFNESGNENIALLNTLLLDLLEHRVLP